MPVYKYTLEPLDEQAVEMPVNSRILSVMNQREEIVLYAIVPDNPGAMQRRKIIIRGTGHPSDNAYNASFIGTVSLHEGSLMFHVFEGVRWNS